MYLQSLFFRMLGFCLLLTIIGWLQLDLFAGVIYQNLVFNSIIIGVSLIGILMSFHGFLGLIPELKWLDKLISEDNDKGDFSGDQNVSILLPLKTCLVTKIAFYHEKICK